MTTVELKIPTSMSVTTPAELESILNLAFGDVESMTQSGMYIVNKLKQDRPRSTRFYEILCNTLKVTHVILDGERINKPSEN